MKLFLKNNVYVDLFSEKIFLTADGYSGIKNMLIINKKDYYYKKPKYINSITVIIVFK